MTEGISGQAKQDMLMRNKSSWKRKSWTWKLRGQMSPRKKKKYTEWLIPRHSHQNSWNWTMSKEFCGHPGIKYRVSIESLKNEESQAGIRLHHGNVQCYQRVEEYMQSHQWN